jgi:hypothetical protein
LPGLDAPGLFIIGVLVLIRSQLPLAVISSQ